MTKTVTITDEQDTLVRELARARWGDKHGNRARFVREAVDEKIEREKQGVTNE